MKTRIFLSIGSNIGVREKNLQFAVDHLHRTLSDMKVSSVYETSAVDVDAQPDFLNAVVSGFTTLKPFSFLKEISLIESAAGRDRTSGTRRGPRTLDIDILLFGNIILNEPALTIPHPRMKQRLFVLVPLIEISPDIIDPAGRDPLRELLAGIPEQGIRKIELSLDNSSCK